MLAELSIRNFAIIDDLSLKLAPGLNVLTGETGAGKSIILDAMALVLGERADTSMIRAGSDEARVEAEFRLPAALAAGLQPLLEAEGLEGEQDDSLTLARELRQNGRSICRVNGRAVGLSLLREIGERLVDIHGQGEHLSLLKPRSHLPLLDAFAGLEAERQAVGRQVSALRAVQREMRDLQRSDRERAQRQDLLSFQINEIGAANLKAGEEEELRGERTRLANAEQLAQNASLALALLRGEDGEAPAVGDLLAQVERALAQLARIDTGVEPLLEQFQGLSFQLGEVAHTLRAYQEELEFNPGRLAFVEERLELIGRLKRKYGDDIEAILAWGQRAQAELEAIGQSEERIEALAAQEAERLAEVGRLATALSARRREAASRLAEAVESELAALYMENARFEVAFETAEEEGGVLADGRRLTFDESGVDRVEFLLSANPGEPLRPLAKVASGGETSRLMLALKTSLARADPTPTLIFDEIDQGIGGRVGDVVGRKLWALTRPSSHQVIVVTHLPQLAAYADGHFQVSKRQAAGRTTTTVNLLEGEAQVRELAAMLGTNGDRANSTAAAILEHVEASKRA
ncbi:MAG: DNA repair protein RecN [Candidatus Promineifilaceae bacterium]